MTSNADPQIAARIEDAVCLRCGCLCDDIAPRVEAGRVVEALRACSLGASWLLGDIEAADAPRAAIDGRPASDIDATSRAAELLADARALLIFGLSGSDTETVSRAAELAEATGAAVELAHAAHAEPRLCAFQRVGRVSATLGEVADRADVVVFWGVDPETTHPRHLERYSADPLGRFIPDGRAGRTIIVVDAAPNHTSARADRFLEIQPAAALNALLLLRMIVRGSRYDVARVARTTALDLDSLGDFASILRKSQYCAFFYDDALGHVAGGSAAVEALFALVRDLNASSRCVAIALGSAGNPAGAESALAWRTGHATRVEFTRFQRGAQAFPAGDSSARRLERGGFDLAMIVGDGVEAALEEPARSALARLPRIVVGSESTSMLPATAVALRAARTGKSTRGTLIRADGVALPTRPCAASTYPDSAEWMRAIHSRLDARSTRHILGRGDAR